MANIYLDTNIILDIIHRQKHDVGSIIKKNNQYHISALTIHIVYYVAGYQVPDERVNAIAKYIRILPVTNNIIKDAMFGPTKDLEDNIQLLSAVSKNCDIFLTEDKKLQKMRMFGNMRIDSLIHDT